MPQSTPKPLQSHPELTTALAAEIRVEMARRGITMRRMATETGKNIGTVSRKLNGLVTMSVSDAFAFARVVGLPLSVLVELAEDAADGLAPSSGVVIGGLTRRSEIAV